MEWGKKQRFTHCIGRAHCVGLAAAAFIMATQTACNVIDPNSNTLLAAPDTNRTIERVTLILHNRTESDAEVDIFLDDALVTYPVAAGKILSIRLRCADVITYFAHRFPDATGNRTIPVDQQVLRDIDYNCDDVLLLNIHDQSPELRIVVIEPQDPTQP